MVYGRLEQIDDRWQLRFTRRLPHPLEKVWRALTEPEHLAAWFPTTIEGERAAGAALRFAFHEGEAPPLDGEMLTYEPPRVLEFRWDDDTLRFELQPDGDGTVLTLLNTFDELGRASRDAAGWHECLDLLGYHLTGEHPPWAPGQKWGEVHPDYVEQFGPEASTIGPPEG
ncbi:MAG: SRPBCC family protein [Acidimicrobiia bacterium]